MAEPSLPTRDECERLLGWEQGGEDCEQEEAVAEKEAVHSAAFISQQQRKGAGTESFPILFASRIHSMWERLELWSVPGDVFG